MARIECEECGREISTDYFPCRHCGKPGFRKVGLFLLLLFATWPIVFVVLIRVWPSGSP